ncbi:Unconventional myosin-Va, partial [Biomphalaria glabrata]
MDKLLHFWGKKDAPSKAGHESVNTSQGLSCSVASQGVVADSNSPESSHVSAPDSGFSSKGTEEMREEETLDHAHALTGSGRTSRSEFSSQTASREDSLSDFSILEHLSNASVVDSRRTSQSDLSFYLGSRRGSQSDFTSAATSRRSSQSDLSAGGFGKNVVQRAAKKVQPLTYDPYRRFDLQFLVHNIETSDFYVK